MRSCVNRAGLALERVRAARQNVLAAIGLLLLGGVVALVALLIWAVSRA